jgi:2-polyprenyl-3-methyl-5-hydroxy-6-metoxy-1,4-benzoquinol methylase
VIICPHCSSPLIEDADRFSCSACQYRAKKEDGLIVFNPEITEDHQDYRSEGLDAVYQQERLHPWFRHRVNIIRGAFRHFAARTEDILEVGAGTGYTARALLEDGYRNLSVGEIHKNGLFYAKQYGLKRLYQFDLRSSPFREHFDVVGLFDVLEHIADDGLAVKNLHKMLRPGGRVILTVPAHRWLWGRIDELSSHHRRYNRQSLASLLRAGGFEVLKSRYFFTALVPALLVRSYLSRNARWETIESESGLTNSPLGNLVLRLASGPGDFMLAPLRGLLGGSLLAVARKT